METITQPSDITAVWTGDAPNDTWLEYLIRMAERRLARLVGELPGPYDVQLIKDTVTAMVTRVLRNPEGFVSEGDADYNYRRAEGKLAGMLYVTEDELLDFQRPATSKFRTAKLGMSCAYRGTGRQ